MLRPSITSRILVGRMRAIALATLSGVLLAASLPAVVSAQGAATDRYLVTYNGTYALSGKYALGGNYALNHQYALSLVNDAGGVVVSDMSRQIGVMVVDGRRQDSPTLCVRTRWSLRSSATSAGRNTPRSRKPSQAAS